eukprot:m.62034 g.62034  ORF g.62034 m.62034 type:complete len:54 (+) comp15786_c1_seq1:51-212(+)
MLNVVVQLNLLVSAIILESNVCWSCVHGFEPKFVCNASIQCDVSVYVYVHEYR